jgi:hypothetical protein
MKIVFAILLIVATRACTTSSCTPSDISKCGIDSTCWTCRNNKCKADNDGHTCDDQNPLTYNDKCQHNGDCIGQSMMCIPCTNDASCGDTLSLVGRVRAGLWQWMMPWQSLNCLNTSCLTEPNTGRKCCGFVPTPKAQCDANDPLTICWNDGSCKPAPLTGTELCQRVSEHCNTVSDCDPIPNLSPCLQLLCTRGACNVGYKPSGAVCATHGVCNGRGQCNVTCTGGTSTCPAEMRLCGQGQICTTIATDPQNCGDCDFICDDGQACVAGVCYYLCPATESMCSGKCVDLTSDDQNCGSCGVACASGYKCTNGTCKVSCLYGHTLCGTTCADFTSDSNNCGACGVVCGTGKACVNSVCTLLCNSPLVPCNGMCADTTTNPSCCGSGHNLCASGSVCISSVCTPLCPSPRVSCSGMCEDTYSDFNNCGACGHACLATQACDAGSCKPLCLSPKIVCGAGTCIDNLTDSSNCGTCGHACPTGQQCVAGTCTLVCPAGQTKCAGVCVQLSTSPNNCGSCGVVCPAGAAHTQGVCVSGVCETACTPYYADCDHNSTNGCEANLMTDALHCSTCATICPIPDHATSAICTGGVCKFTCNAGYADCDLNPANGCETQITTNLNNCGACNNTCPIPSNTVPHCSGGSCSWSCVSNFADCNGLASDGCEASLISNTNCGGCGIVCVPGDTCNPYLHACF